MIVIKARNVQAALPMALATLRIDHIESDSRNGKVFVFREPVTTVYEQPQERVIFWGERDANPFFHLAESLWMLGGRNDVAYVSSLVGRMAEYSDDGKTFNAAYGHRWRRHFGYDQLAVVIENLKANPNCRRQVVQIWDGHHDLRFKESKDLPCNIAAHFRIQEGQLHMTVFNRSNDLVWGAYGANAVHFSFLQEYVARGVGASIGKYWQVSDNLHAYEATLDQVADLADFAPTVKFTNPYEINPEVKYQPLLSRNEDISSFDSELDIFLEEGVVMGMRNKFLRRIAGPMLQAYREYKRGRPTRYEDALAILATCEVSDWRVAGEEWIVRRREAHRKFHTAQDDGVSYE